MHHRKFASPIESSGGESTWWRFHLPPRKVFYATRDVIYTREIRAFFPVHPQDDFYLFFFSLLALVSGEANFKMRALKFIEG